MTAVKLILRWIRRCFLALMLLYWTLFAGSTVVKLIEGGPARVAAWYKYNGSWLVPGDAPGSFVLMEMTWRQFIAVQLFYLAVTLFLGVFELKPARPKAETRGTREL